MRGGDVGGGDMRGGDVVVAVGSYEGLLDEEALVVSKTMDPAEGGQKKKEIEEKINRQIEKRKKERKLIKVTENDILLHLQVGLHWLGKTSLKG